jgi:4-hydroxy-tetrahydrodipicolinate reductase
MRALIWGFGQLGRAIARAAIVTGRCEVVGIVDCDPALVGRPVSEFLPGAGEQRILAALPEYAETEAEIVFHAIGSAREATTSQVLAAIDANYSVVSAAEWLFHPWLRHPAEAEALDRAARSKSERVVGCGINPGFSFDTLPLILSRTTHDFSSIRIKRVADVSGEGPAGFHHLGFGLTKRAFAERVIAGTIEGHMGFPESIAALAERLDLQIDRITDHLEPTIAARPLQLSHRLIGLGEVVGITQKATAYVRDRAIIRMDLEMFLDPAGYGRSPHESIEFEGSRSFTVTIKPAALPADGAAAMMLYAANALSTVGPGLVSLFDLPLGGSPCHDHLQGRLAARSEEGVELSASR